MTTDNIKYLNELRAMKPESYQRKLRILGLNDNDIPHPQTDVAVDPLSKTKVTADPFPDEWNDYANYEDDEYKYSDERKGRLFLIDGDNHVNEGLSGIMNIRKEDSVLVFITQPGLRDRLKKKYKEKINFKNVKPGDQAVDNQIKSMFGNAVRGNKYSSVYIVSHDNGYRDLIKKYKSNSKLSVEMSLIYSIKQVVLKKT